MNTLGSRAGKCGEAAWLVLRADEAAPVADCPLCWEQPGKPVQNPPGWVPGCPCMREEGTGSWKGWHCKLRVTLPCQMVSGWRWQTQSPGQPLPALCSQHGAVGRAGAPWQAGGHAMGCTAGCCPGPGLGPSAHYSEATSDGGKIQHRFKNNIAPKICFPQYGCCGLILDSPEHNLIC